MTIRRIYASLLSGMLLLCLPLVLPAQSTMDLKINEVLQYNETGLQDDYGSNHPWIEIFNSAYNTVSMGGLYFTDDLNNLTKYSLPKGDPRLSIPPRNYLLFWADNNPSHGIFYLNFDIRESGFIALVDANGKTIIDSITLTAQQPDVTYGRRTDGEAEWIHLQKNTPNSPNFTDYIEPQAERFGKLDPYGYGMAAVAMSVVFGALIVLYLVFFSIGRGFSLDWKKRKLLKKGKIVEAEALPSDTSGEINAAIVMALHLYMSEIHDNEQAVLTIKKISRTYSPWSSKIYGLRRSPR